MILQFALWLVHFVFSFVCFSVLIGVFVAFPGLPGWLFWACAACVALVVLLVEAWFLASRLHARTGGLLPKGCAR
ncbi:MAG: hypothetical protein F4103_04635 [Boseongicola sp. SB0673_bin_14]|nr:hypothetical protein [Boseongicola sp. SB0673_bin_14]